jgi:hypothetical protein
LSTLTLKIFILKYLNFEIAVWAPYPSSEQLKDGYYQRVASVDGLIENRTRLYIGLYLKKYLLPKVRRADKLAEVHANIIYVIFFWIYCLVFCKKIYFHSVIEASKGFPIVFLKQTFIDLHGVVPEEMQFVKRNLLAGIFGFVESLVLKRAYKIISVTNSLKLAIQSKYPWLKDDVFIVLPIFPASIDENSVESFVDREGFIYAGGTQPWQNIDIILKFSSTVKKFRGYLLVGSIDRLYSSYNKEFGEIFERWTIDSVAPREMPKYYRKVKFGFLIRDDSIVNRVACPTKLVEYIKYGVVPVMGFSDLGDFKKYGLKYFDINDFDLNRAEAQYKEFATKNLEVYFKFKNAYCFGSRSLCDCM